MTKHSSSSPGAAPVDLASLPDCATLQVRYQPQAETLGGRITGLHGQLFCLNESAALYVDECKRPPQIEHWMFEEMCRQIGAWRDEGLPALRHMLRIAETGSIFLTSPELICRTLRQYRIEPRQIALSVPEALFSCGEEQTRYGIEHLRTLGMQLIVDDFGVGYSSLSHLRKMPGSTVKINRNLISQLNRDQDRAALVKALIRLAHSLSLRVMAGAVDDEEQLSQLIAEGCNELQGDYFSPALTAEACRAFIQSGRRLPSEKFYASEEDRVLLVVDDEPNITSALRRMLRDEGYRILVAHSGQQGLELLAGNAAGVIISDQRMPGMTGVEFLRQVKTLYPDTVRLVLSGYTELKSVTDAINEGAIYKFVTKPWDDTQLKDLLREAFQHFGMRRENKRLSEEILLANEKLAKANLHLEQQVLEKTEEIRRSFKVLQVSQEILQQLPVAVIGIDEDGLIVMSNQKADTLFAEGGPLFGSDARDRLPQRMLSALDFDDDGEMKLQFSDAEHRTWQVHRQLMTAQDATRKILILTLSAP